MNCEQRIFSVLLERATTLLYSPTNANYLYVWKHHNVFNPDAHSLSVGGRNAAICCLPTSDKQHKEKKELPTHSIVSLFVCCVQTRSSPADMLSIHFVSTHCKCWRCVHTYGYKVVHSSCLCGCQSPLEKWQPSVKLGSELVVSRAIHTTIMTLLHNTGLQCFPWH